MITKYYNCEFLSDIVLPASSNTQGNIALSDFISGSNFLGMVATKYDSFGSDAFEVFHSGDVSFGDAHISIDAKPTYKIPLSYHNLKVGDEKYNRLHLTKDEEEKLREEQKQLKQMRNGFMDSDLKFVNPSYNYSQKSSYDKEQRKSKDSGMYGYSALKSGSNWIFKVSYSDEKYVQKVEDNLLGDKKLGKSKSSEYGAVKITSIDAPKEVETFKPTDDKTYIYIASRLALYDENGDFTTIPSISNLGLDSGEILWDETYIKTSTYTPYNYKRETKEYTRVCINKGSVITIKGCRGELKQKIGAFISEGFGDVIQNPKFLEPKNPPLIKYTAKQKEIKTDAYNKELISFLQHNQKEENIKFELAIKVQNVYEKFIDPSKSQWGQIRSFASSAKNSDELVENIKEYISHGKEKKQWENIQTKLFEEIQNSQNPIEFVKLLSMIVSKHTRG